MNQLDLEFNPAPKASDHLGSGALVFEKDPFLLKASDYQQNHPWYYLLGGKPPTFDEIEPYKSEGLDCCRMTLREAEVGLAEDRARYEDICTRGVEAMSRYDLASSIGPDVAVSVALSLKRNHIAWHKGMIEKLKSRPTKK